MSWPRSSWSAQHSSSGISSRPCSRCTSSVRPSPSAGLATVLTMMATRRDWLLLSERAIALGRKPCCSASARIWRRVSGFMRAARAESARHGGRGNAGQRREFNRGEFLPARSDFVHPQLVSASATASPSRADDSFIASHSFAKRTPLATGEGFSSLPASTPRNVSIGVSTISSVSRGSATPSTTTSRHAPQASIFTIALA